MFFRMSIFLQRVVRGQIEFERVLLQDLRDAAIVSLKLHLELVELVIKLSEITINLAKDVLHSLLSTILDITAIFAVELTKMP